MQPPTMAAAFAAYERGEFVEAERLFREALAADTASFESHHLLAVIAARFGRHDAALAAYDRALRLKPGDVQALHAASRRIAVEELFPLSDKLPVVMYGSGRVISSYGVDCAMNTLIQRGIVRARAIFPPLVIGPNDPRDSDNLNSRRDGSKSAI